MSRPSIRSLTVITLTATVAACGGDGGSTGPNGQANGEFRFRAKIDGAEWVPIRVCRVSGPAREPRSELRPQDRR